MVPVQPPRWLPVFKERGTEFPDKLPDRDPIRQRGVSRCFIIPCWLRRNPGRLTRLRHHGRVWGSADCQVPVSHWGDVSPSFVASLGSRKTILLPWIVFGPLKGFVFAIEDQRPEKEV